MGIFDFLKKIFEDDKIIEKEKEKVAFSDIGNWVENKAKENEGREKEVLSLIENRINLFTNELKVKIDAVENVDVESKKAEDKLKSITNEGRKKYLEAIDIFIRNLEKLEKNNFEKFIENINNIFLNFDKSSRMSYERATILIGKEMENVKENIKIFSKEIIDIFNENKNIIDSSKTISIAKLNLGKIAKIEKEIGGVSEAMISLDKKMKDKKEENEKMIERIEEIKKSTDYLKNLEKQKKIKILEDELENNILELKQIIDFKGLSSFFHIFNEEMKVVKLHKEDFSAEFKKDYGKSILNLLNEAKLSNETILEKIKEIKIKKEEMEKNKQKIKKDATQELYSETTKMLMEIGNLNNEKTREEKRMEKLKLNKEEMIEKIKENIKKMGVEVISYSSN